MQDACIAVHSCVVRLIFFWLVHVDNTLQHKGAIYQRRDENVRTWSRTTQIYLMGEMAISQVLLVNSGLDRSTSSLHRFDELNMDQSWTQLSDDD